MEDQFSCFPIWTKVELHPNALALDDDEGSTLVRTEFVGWLAPNCQRELFIAVLSDNNSRDSLAEHADAVLTEGGVHAIAGWNATEDDIFEERLERSRQTRNVSLTVGGKCDGEPLGQRSAGRLGQLERIVVPMRERLGHTAIRPVQSAFGMGDCDPAVTGMVVITGIVRKVMARPGV
jgi:hypothetical protein